MSRADPSAACEATSRSMAAAPDATPGRRLPAGERRAQVIAAAIARFGEGGYHGT